jgi:hypothetical protein
MRLATYNVEWMNALFDDGGNLLIDNELSARHEITRAAQIAALVTVFQSLDADGIMVIEAPDTSPHRSTITALETFAAHAGIRARRAVTGFVSGTEQEIAFLYDPDRLRVTHDPQASRSAPRFDTSLALDLNRNGNKRAYVFSKPPLELQLHYGDETLRLIGVHAKSKVPHGKVSATAFRRISLENRAKQLAECHWVRARVTDLLAAKHSVIVMGDLNDGPGIDAYEKAFGQSGVEVVLGLNGPKSQRLTDPHALMALRPGLHPTSARFWLAPRQCYFEALLDFIMLSPDLAAQSPKWRIWHPFNDPAIPQPLRDAILTASDHFPVTLDL